MLCSMLTILPDFLIRRFVQGKRIGQEITLYSVWYELRWGITLCILLTLSLITLIFYNHPATTSVISYFRTIPIMIEGSGRVAEVYVNMNDKITAGDRLFRMDDAKQRAAVETARRNVAEVESTILIARSELAASEAKIQEAESAYQQALDELETKTELRQRNENTVTLRDLERLQNIADGRLAGVASARANQQSAEAKISSLLPAEKASAEAALAQAQVELDKTVVYAGVNGRVEQFALRPGDFVNPISRPAGILIPEEAGRLGFQAGFNQIEAQVMKVGMIAEMVCTSKPFTVIPMVVTKVQDFVASGQVRPTDQLLDPSLVAKPGTILVMLEPLFAGELQGLPPGSSCIANAYTSNYDRLHSEELGTMHRIALHVIDTVGLVHAMILRIKALVMPLQVLVFSGH